MRKQRIAFVVLAFCILSSPAFSQTSRKKNPNSPVFKNYQPPTSAPLLEQSDATYQMWQGFRIQQEANGGDPVSQFELSIRYLTGRGFKADTVRAAYWTKKAADQNHILARYNLAIFEFNGWGTEWNPFESYRNFRFAAERNMPEAEYVLAQFLTENLIVPRNWNEAYRWVKLAADSGYAPAQESLKEFERRGFAANPDTATSKPTADKKEPKSSNLQLTFLNFSPDTIRHTPDSLLVDDVMKAAAISHMPEVQQRVGSIILQQGKMQMDSSTLNFLRRSADAGSPEALTLLGRSYEESKSPQRDIVRAASYYVRAIRLDSPRAGRLLFNLIQEKDLFSILKTQVNENNPDALYVWPVIVALEFDRRITDAQALQMLQRAATLNYSQAIVELGLCYYTGRWVKKDAQRAEGEWRKAAALGNKEASVRLAVLKIRNKRKEYASAIPLLEQSMTDGSVLAEFALAYCYENGVGVQENKGKAAQMYRSSGQRGSQDAFRALQRMLDEIRPKDKMFRVGDS